MRAKKARDRAGFTLIELMIVVAIIGVLAALATYGVASYVANSKTAEAQQMLGRISKDHLGVFESARQDYAVLPAGSATGSSGGLCPDATGVPAGIGTPAAPVSLPLIRSSKWQPNPTDFRDGAGWECLRFEMTTPLYFGYGMDSTQSGVSAAAGDGFVAYAIGDLDGDAEPGTLELGGEIQANASGSTVLVLATTVKRSTEL